MTGRRAESLVARLCRVLAGRPGGPVAYWPGPPCSRRPEGSPRLRCALMDLGRRQKPDLWRATAEIDYGDCCWLVASGTGDCRAAAWKAALDDLLYDDTLPREFRASSPEELELKLAVMGGAR